MRLISWLLACGGTGAIDPHPAVIVAGDPLLEHTGWAVVGEVSSPPPTGLLGDVAAGGRRVVLAGDAVQVAAVDAWARLGTRWQALPVLPLRGASERRVDPRSRRFDALWPEAVPWGRIDVGPHRLLWLDPSDPVDQRFWLPGALARPDGGVVVFLAESSASVERQVLEAAPPSALALIVSGAANGNRARLPQGRWGVMELEVGPTHGGVLEPARGAEGFHAAHREVLEAELPASSWALRPEATLRDALGPGGWWALDVDPGGLTVALRRRGNDGRWGTAYRARWTRDGGWEQEGAAKLPATSSPGSASTPTAHGSAGQGRLAGAPR